LGRVVYCLEGSIVIVGNRTWNHVPKKYFRTTKIHDGFELSHLLALVYYQQLYYH